jgi:hypothetical protein
LTNIRRKKNQEGFISDFQKKLEPAKNLLGLINITRAKNQEGFILDFQKKLEAAKTFLV